MFTNWSFLLGEIWFLLLLAALLGLLAGWLIWNRASEMNALRAKYDAQSHALETTTAEHAALSSQHARLESEFDESRVAFETQQRALMADHARLDGELREQTERYTELEGSLEEVKTREGALVAKLGEHDALITARNTAETGYAEELARVQRRDETISLLKTDLQAEQANRTKVSDLEAQLAAMRNRAEKADQLSLEVETLSVKANKAEQLERELANARASSDGLQTYKAQVAERDATIATLRAQLAGSASTPSSTASHIPDYDGDGKLEGRDEGRKPQILHSARGGQPDDLKRIKGVGPALEKMLHGLGFYHYDQVAAWTTDEVAWVDANLDGFSGRVSRDEWVAQAKVLAAGGETEFAARVDDGAVYN